jgi:5-formyltetrahydrofolate cyclo-ligase
MTQPTDQSSKGRNAELRHKLRVRRRQITESLRTAYDKAIRQHILQFVKAKGIESIAVFWPFDGEPDTIPLYRELVALGKKIALPIVSGNDDHLMNFYLWETDTVLKRNRYGIAEPQNSAQIAVADFDMMLVPLVAYDRRGNRIGMGSGYYDRHLENLRNWHTPLRLGVAYSMQEIDQIDKNDWDIPLHAIVNERGWFTFDNNINEQD